ncbi:hypothetical protein OG948_60305 (plasmid) [Embleya sp. NBC_00888]|uniref:hypothetical protein n=1 Tax=Embleya sp. NBC_00888 TaxID=2975960 RepID=UPI002F91202B|nr:hypothetical protein OG948_60305 [Embleya sp. NBC_00888]
MTHVPSYRLDPGDRLVTTALEITHARGTAQTSRTRTAHAGGRLDADDLRKVAQMYLKHLPHDLFHRVATSANPVETLHGMLAAAFATGLDVGDELGRVRPDSTT